MPFYILLRIPLCIVRCPITETVPVRSQTALFLQRPSSRLPRRHPKLPFEGTDKRRFMLKATVICDIADPFLRIVQQFSGFLELLSSDILRQRNAIILLKYRLQIGRRQVDMLCNLLNGQLLCQIVSYIGKTFLNISSSLLIYCLTSMSAVIDLSYIYSPECTGSSLQRSHPGKVLYQNNDSIRTDISMQQSHPDNNMPAFQTSPHISRQASSIPGDFPVR